jgi:transcriptional regulator with GAF, ATPase, and Fis domain
MTAVAYVGAAIAEIVGCFAFWAWLRLDKPVWWLVPGIASLALHRWPGNMREFENTIHCAVLLASGPEIGVDGILTPDGVPVPAPGGGEVRGAA